MDETNKKVFKNVLFKTCVCINVKTGSICVIRVVANHETMLKIQLFQSSIGIGIIKYKWFGVFPKSALLNIKTIYIKTKLEIRREVILLFVHLFK